MQPQNNYILWLPSWYPNRYDPYNGDFIQRHAHATASFVRIVVFHFVVVGETTRIDISKEEIISTSNLEEHICYQRFVPAGVKAFDNIRYNINFYLAARIRLKQYFKENGLPVGVHVHVPVKAGNLAIWIKKKWGIPFILSEHSSGYLPQSPDYFFKRHFLYRRQVQAVFKNAAAVTNVSQTIGNLLQNIFTVKKVTVIHNVVDTGFFFFIKKATDDVFRFFHASVLNDQKNIAGMLQAFKLLNEYTEAWQLTLAGPVSPHLQQLIKDAGLQNKVFVTGMIPYKRVAEKMQEADAFVLFSRHENFPCVVVEALCCGLPVVAAAVAGVGEAVNAGNGILVKNEDEKDLAEALYRMILQYKNYHPEVIAAAAQARYSYPVIGSQIFNLYQANFGIGQ